MKNFRYPKKFKTFVALFVIWIITLSFGLYFRLYPLTHYVPNDSSEKATMLVINQLRAKVANQVNIAYPQLPKEEKLKLIKKRFDEVLHKEGAKVRETIESVSANMTKNASIVSDAPPTPYLQASDSYYYYGLTENIIKTGSISKTIKGSKYLNELMLAPEGHWEPLNLHPYVGFITYKILKIFNPNISLMHAVSFTPLIISGLSLMAFIAICALFKSRLSITLVGACFYFLAPIFVKRSTYGWYDNDPYNCLFPLLILTVLIFGLKKLTSNKLTVILGIAASLLILLYSLFWHGWVLIYSIIFISSIIILFYNQFFLKNKFQTANLIRLLIGTCFFSFIFVGVLFGFTEFFVLFKEGWIALKNFLSPQLSSWPDLYISVGELHKAPLSLIIDLTGGSFFFLISTFGFLGALFNIGTRNKGAQPFALLIITTFLIITLFIATGAQRFALLSLVPLSLLFVLGLNYLLNIFLLLTAKILPNRKLLIRFFEYIFLFALITSIALPIQTAKKSIKSLLTPIFNQTWERALTKIKEDTPKNSIINSWWSPGHFIKTFAQRKVTFDGATINTPQAYWMSNVFLSQTEEEALGYLRMINGSGNNATEYLQELGFSLSSSIFIIKEVTKLNRQQAGILLLRALKDQKQINKLLKLTHSNPPPSYILIYNEFVDANLQLKFIGDWNFKRIEEINKNPDLLKKVPKANSEDYVQFLWLLNGGPYKYSGVLAPISKSEDTITFAQNVLINTQNMTATINSHDYGKGIPHSIFYLKDGAVQEKSLSNASLPFSILFFQDKNQSGCVLLDQKLANSFLIQLYFFDGHAYKYIKPFLRENDLTKRTDIRVYKIDWPSFMNN